MLILAIETSGMGGSIALLEDDAVLAHGFHQGAAFGDGVGEGFFQIDALAGPGRVEGDERMPEIRRADDDAIDVLTG